ncbi:transcriptional regulator [bacterium]|nr:MAG: transcriptional regulator [bacterium]
MKISAIGSKKQKRVVRLVLEADNEIDEAILFEKFEMFGIEPPSLNPHLQVIVEMLKNGEIDTNDISEKLLITPNNANHRLNDLMKLNLVARKPKLVGVQGRAFTYWLNRRGSQEPKPSTLLTAEDE